MEKSWIFVFFQEVMDNCYFKEKAWNFAEIISSIHKAIYGSFLVCIYKFTACVPSHSLVHCMYHGVCVVMIVAVRGCHLYLSKKFKFMVKVYFRVCRSYS